MVASSFWKEDEFNNADRYESLYEIAKEPWYESSSPGSILT